MCREWKESAVSVNDHFNVVSGLLFCLWFDLLAHKQTRKIHKLWECQGPRRLGHVKLWVFQRCCTVIALLPHPHKQVNGNCISNTSGQGQAHGNFAFAFYCIYKHTESVCNTARKIIHTHTQKKNIRSVDIKILSVQADHWTTHSSWYHLHILPWPLTLVTHRQMRSDGCQVRVLMFHCMGSAGPAAVGDC